MKFPDDGRLRTGLAVPVFSLRSSESCGTGEFEDLVALGRWCRDVGFDLIQILPINDTGNDPSPYNAQSAFALNPLFLRLERLPGSERFRTEIAQARTRFGSTDRLNYQDVRTFKRYIASRCFENEWTRIREDPMFHSWVEKNLSWIPAYAVFRFMKSRRLSRPWSEWESEPDELIAEHWDAGNPHVAIYAWLQYQLEAQLTGATRELESNGVCLKGDIPILVSEDSADVWHRRSQFDLAFRAGAPPDMFTEEGQNWRFPTYHWDVMEADGYAWWKDRLRQASKFYHAFRLDHVLGFFRIWSIPEAEMSARYGFYWPSRLIGPEELEAIPLDSASVNVLVENKVLIPAHGGFAPAWYYARTPHWEFLDDTVRKTLELRIHRYWSDQEDLWRAHGSAVLRELKAASDMLICAEDLGAVPEVVPEVLEELRILGLRVERWIQKEGAIVDPSTYRRLTVCSPSTHDMPTLREWWEQNDWDRDAYFRAIGGTGECPTYLTTSMAEKILARNLGAGSQITILTLQDLFALHYDLRTYAPGDERINVPGTDRPNNWSWRMKISIEDLTRYREFNRKVRTLVSARGRK